MEAVAESPQEDSEAVAALAASNAAATVVSHAPASVCPTDSKAAAAMMEAHDQRPPATLSTPDSQNHHGNCATTKHHQGDLATAQSAARQKGGGERDGNGAILGIGGPGRGDAASSRAGKAGASDDDFDRRLEGYSCKHWHSCVMRNDGTTQTRWCSTRCFTNPHVHRYTLGQLQMSETVYVMCKQHADGGLLYAPVPVARTTAQAQATTT